MLQPESFQFLKDLKQNNNREWFISQAKCYEEYKKNYRQLGEAFIAEMSKVDESLSQLDFKDVSFRINRDIRFSKDKTPYKTNMAIWLSEGTKNTNLAGYYVHIEPGASFIAAGIHYPDAADLRKIRREIKGFYEDLEEIVAEPQFKKIYGALDSDENNTLKSAPKDFDKDHPAIQFLRLKSFTATAKLTDKEVQAKDFVKATSEKLLVLQPLVEFINRALTTE
ncbi:DUF2461 domain-containing protein [Flavobacterium sp. J372]|uniref:DUF2461 domain-containing protein n=1 Tax=Flavobacterium sp. J372 TaxID=2898436 RepID=UPI002151FB4D|nr:DUF2461 domain-containing protein [Flavobacterium sp. J372]MCR5861865.1 DUF2461 domain-containing protein [Flavobacterium sp. J372]